MSQNIIGNEPEKLVMSQYLNTFPHEFNGVKRLNVHSEIEKGQKFIKESEFEQSAHLMRIKIYIKHHNNCMA